QRRDGQHLVWAELGEAMRQLRAARVAEQQELPPNGVAGHLRQLLDVVNQRFDQLGVFAGDLRRVGPVAVLDRGRDQQPAVLIGLFDEITGERLAVAAHAVQSNEYLLWSRWTCAARRTHVHRFDLRAGQR